MSYKLIINGARVNNYLTYYSIHINIAYTLFIEMTLWGYRFSQKTYQTDDYWRNQSITYDLRQME